MKNSLLPERDWNIIDALQFCSLYKLKNSLLPERDWNLYLTDTQFTTDFGLKNSLLPERDWNLSQYHTFAHIWQCWKIHYSLKGIETANSQLAIISLSYVEKFITPWKGLKLYSTLSLLLCFILSWKIHYSLKGIETLRAVFLFDSNPARWKIHYSLKGIETINNSIDNFNNPKLKNSLLPERDWNQESLLTILDAIGELKNSLLPERDWNQTDSRYGIFLNACWKIHYSLKGIETEKHVITGITLGSWKIHYSLKGIETTFLTTLPL